MNMYSDDEEIIPKKTKGEQKREAEAAQALGAQLVKLSATQLKELCEKLELPDKLHAALLECRSIKSHEAHRRQLQYIGKLMRDIDTAPVQQQLAEFKRGGQVAAAQLHQIEHWRDRLLSEGDSALTEFLNQYPQANAQQLRQLIANAQREASRNQPPKSARLLFKSLREFLAE